MGFLQAADTKYARTEFVAVQSLDYLKGAHIKKLSTADILEMSATVGTEEVENEDGVDDSMDKVIGFLSKHVYDDKKNVLPAEEAQAFFKSKPIGDLVKLQQEVLKVSGAVLDMDELTKK